MGVERMQLELDIKVGEHVRDLLQQTFLCSRHTQQTRLLPMIQTRVSAFSALLLPVVDSDAPLGIRELVDADDKLVAEKRVLHLLAPFHDADCAAG